MRLASPSTDANARSKNGPSPTSLAVHYGTFVRNEMQTALDLRGLRKACEMKEVPFVRAKEGRFGMERGGEGEGEGEGGKSERKGADKGRFVVRYVRVSLPSFISVLSLFILLLHHYIKSDCPVDIVFLHYFTGIGRLQSSRRDRLGAYVVIPVQK